MSPKERRIELGGTPFHVVDSARRGLLPVIGVHGFPGGDHMTLRGTPGFDQLAARTRVVHYDQRGAGHSGGWEAGAGGEAETPSIGRHAADLLALIETLGLERPIAVAHDAGSTVALRAAYEQPAALSGLVLICPLAARGGEARQAFEQALGERLEETDVRALLEPGDGDPDIALRGAMGEIFPVGFLRFGLSERTFMERVTFRRQAYDGLWEALVDDTSPPLAELRVPVLVMVGRFDPLVDLGAA
ncbi:MAG: alpha/beta hydrolase, partial [Candidatus Eiseniibacteriota bacterium]